MNANAPARGRPCNRFARARLLPGRARAARSARAVLTAAASAALAAAGLGLACALAPPPAAAQDEAQSEPQANVVATPLRLELIDTPTAQTLPRGTYEFALRLLSGGSAVSGARVGMIDAFTFGFHYGGTEILASGDPDWNPRVEFYAKLRVLRETTLPGLAIGYDSQGLGLFDEELDRYEVKSRGFYATSDKTWPIGGFLSLHGGISRTLEDDDDDDSPTLFGGVQKSIGDPVVFLLEYDLALNDDNGSRYGRGRGYLNSGLAWSVTDAFALELTLRNMTENTRDDGLLGDWNREIRFRYAEFF